MTLSESIFFFFSGKEEKAGSLKKIKCCRYVKHQKLFQFSLTFKPFTLFLNILTTSYCFLYYLCMENSYY